MASKRGLQRLVILGLIVVVPVCVWLLWPRPSDRQLILDLVAKAEHGVETKNTEEIMSCVSRDYRDPTGLTRVDIFRLAMQWERTSEQVDVVIDEYELTVTPPTATGRFEVELTFSQGGPPELPQRLPLTVEFAKERKGVFGKAWRVNSVGGHGLEKDFEGLM
jgi:hypothetical protein